MFSVSIPIHTDNRSDAYFDHWTAEILTSRMIANSKVVRQSAQPELHLQHNERTLVIV